MVLDIPMNIQRLEVDPIELISFYDSKEYFDLQSKDTHLVSSDIESVIDDLQKAKRPIILV